MRTAFQGLVAGTFKTTLVVMPMGQCSPARESDIEHIIAAHREFANVRGIRHMVSWHDDPSKRFIDRPDLLGREAILKVHVRNIKLGTDVDLRRVAGLTPGTAGADLANLVNEAALMAARAGKEEVTMAEFNEAVERGDLEHDKDQGTYQFPAAA